ncbi:MAG: hypothetical protein GY762_20930 [Proteobacteria bacterium]|nr:hypothetical protein [Pseudomonadota bacterium]
MRLFRSRPSPQEEQLNDFVHKGDRLLRKRQTGAACDQWLQAWELVKQMATPDMTTLKDFEQTYRGLDNFVGNWCSDLEMELHNAGIMDDPIYHEHRLRFARDFVQRFPDESTLSYLNSRRAEGEALWDLGRQAESEACYADLVEKLPDEAWSYIGWADHYWIFRNSTKVYAKGEEILLRALARPELNDRMDALERLADLYEEWEIPEKQAEIEAEMDAIREQHSKRFIEGNKQDLDFILTDKPAVAPPSDPAKTSAKLGRNDPCWCGSGKKYKHCHLQANRSQ